MLNIVIHKCSVYFQLHKYDWKNKLLKKTLSKFFLMNFHNLKTFCLTAI